jgi:hypothetical protein
MSFQAVVRDEAGQLVTTSPVGMRISVIQGSENGAAVFVETHAAQTNSNGLTTLAIGGGSVVSGSFSGIDWLNGPYYLKTEADPLGGSNYSIIGTSQLLSVPYALHAANNQAGPQGPQGPPGTSDCPIIRTADGRAVVYTATTAHGFGLASTGGSQWTLNALDGPVLGSIASDSSVVLWTATSAYAYGLASTGGSFWSTAALSGAPVGALAASGRIVVFTENAAYGHGRASTGGTQWTTTAITGPVLDHVVAGNRIVLVTPTAAYGFGRASTGGSNWSTSALSGAAIGGEGTR